MDSPPKISIVICTYNRSALLIDCLTSLASQTIEQKDFEIIVVDNNSTDNTRSIVEDWSTDFPNLHYVFEPKQGLGHARNTGWKNANTDWVFYLDDDAKAKADMVERALWVIEHKGYPVFGGVYYPWYKYGRPMWYKDSYGSNQLSYSDFYPMPKGESLSGGILVLKKQIIEDYGGFPVNIGMNGKGIGYGEESVLQENIQRNGIQLIYDPELVIYHVVAEYKLNVEWFFKAAWAKGRDYILGGTISTNLYGMLSTFLSMLLLLCLDFIRNTFKLIFQKNYYYENWLIDTFKKVAKRLAVLHYGMMTMYGSE